MRRAASALLFGLLIVLPAAAQQIPSSSRATLRGTEASSAAAARSAGDRPIHVTDRMNGTPEAVAALRASHEARAAGLLPAGKTAEVYAIGTTKEFRVVDNYLTEPEWVGLSFTLRDASAAANVWVETALEGTISAADLAQLSRWVLTETPDGAFRTGHGIIENDNHLFGSPPAFVDTDGILDVLIYDIEEGGTDCCILGYVTTADFTPGWPAGTGNQANVVHVDLPDGIRIGGLREVASTLAHEYQHLIHFNYMTGTNVERTFINEGLSEWASVANGFAARAIGYLGRATEHNRPLLDWRADTNPNASITERINDYERASLYTMYLVERLGPETASSIVRAKARNSPRGDYAVGAEGLEVTLEAAGLTLADVIADFHTANLLNDRVSADRYGYAFLPYAGIHAASTQTFDGMASSATSVRDFTLNSGAVQYLTWENVANLNVRADITASQVASLPATTVSGMRSRVRLRLVAEAVGGGVTIQDLPLDTEGHLIEGDFERATLVVIHAFPGRESVRLDGFASWESVGSAFSIEEVSYDDGKVSRSGGDFDFYSDAFITAQAVLANKFAVPAGARLATVLSAPVYANQFQGSTAREDAACDYTISVYGQGPDGMPGALLYSTTVSEGPGASHIAAAGNNYSFVFRETVIPEAQLAQLPDTVFVALANAGTDNNYLGMALSAHTGANASYLFHPNFGEGGAWAPFSGIFLEGEPGSEPEFPFLNRTHPIRVQFIVPKAGVGVDDGGELPVAVTLGQNYPNPFNPATSIEYTLPEAGHVRLTVFDVMGRRVATLVDGVVPAGLHRARLDATAWASGLYVYALETASTRLTRKMLLVK